MRKFARLILAVGLIMISSLLVFVGCDSDDEQKIITVDIPSDLKTEYLQGDSIDFDSIKVMADGKVISSGYTIEKISERKVREGIRYSELVYAVKMNGSVVGEKIHIRAYDKMKDLSIYLEKKAKTSFYVDETIDYKGWHLKAVYDDGQYGLISITEDMVISEVNTNSAGQKVVSINFLGMITENAATIEVIKYDKELTEIEILESGVDYVIIEGEEGVSYSLDGETWQKEPEFSGLKAGTQYTVYAKVLEDRLNNSSNTITTTFTTKKHSQQAPQLEVCDVTSSSFRVLKEDGVDVWSDNAQRTEEDDFWVFINLQPYTEYSVYAKVLGSDTYYESPVTETRVKTNKIADSIIATSGQTFEYSRTAKVPSFSMQSGTSFSSSKFSIKYIRNGSVVYSAVDAGEYVAIISFKDERYDVPSKEVSFTITPRSITLTADDKEIVYGDKEKILTYRITSEKQMVFGDNLLGNIAREPGLDAGNYRITIGSISNSNYDIEFIEGTYSILKKQAVVTARNASKIYGEQDAALLYSASGLLGTDRLSGRLVREEGEDVGTYKITGEFESNNYDISVESAIFTILPSSNIYFTVESMEVTYDGQPHELIAETKATVDWVYLYNGKSEKPVKAGTYVVDVTAIGKGNYTGTKGERRVLTIKKKDATIKVDNVVKVYGENNPKFTYTINGSVEGDEFGVPDFYTIATKYSDVGTYDVIVSGLSNENYTIVYSGGSLTIKQKEITISADSKSKVYGDKDPELTYTVNTTLDSAILGKLARVEGENVGEYNITVGSLSNGNYDITFIGSKLTIEKAPLLIKVNNVGRELNTENPVFTSTITGLKLNDSIEISYSCEADINSPAGTYAILATADNSNYDIKITPGTLKVNKITNFTVEIDDSILTIEYDGQPHSVIATSNAGDSVEFTYLYNEEETLPINAGSYQVTISAIGKGDYEGEKVLYRTLTILPRSITVTANDASSTYGELEEQLTYSYPDIDLLGNVFTGNIVRESGKNAGEYEIGIGTLALENFEITFISGKYVIVEREITITADDKEKVYGNNNPEFTYAITEGTLVVGDVLGLCTFNVSASKASSVGEYEIGISNIANKNYKCTFISGKLTIVAREVTLIVGENVFTYNGSKINPNVTLLNVANDDDVTIIYDQDVINAGEYTLLASINDENYSLVGNNIVNVLVNKAEQSISVDTTSFEYTGSINSIVAILNEGDGEISYENNSNVNVGEYIVTVKVSETQNYKALSQEIEITIVKANVILENIGYKNDITYGDKLSVANILGTVKFLGAEVLGTFSISNDNEILHSGNHEVEITFTPENNNLNSASVVIEITILKKTVEITIEEGGKGVGNLDPIINYTLTGVVEGEIYNPVIVRAKGETIGEYDYSVVDDGLGDYVPTIVSNTKFHILEKLVEFSGYSSEYIYRVGVTNGYTMQLAFKSGYDISKLQVALITISGTAGGSFNGEVMTFTGSGKIKVCLKIKDKFNVIFDEKIFEVVANAVNATTFSQIKSNVDTCLHNDVILTNTISISAGVTLYGNGHTIDGTNWKPTGNYESLIVLYGTLDNVKAVGPYAYDGFNDASSGETDFYRTTQVVYMYGNAKILNSHIEAGRYAVRIGAINNALIENSTLKNGTQTIFIKPSNGGINEVLTLRNVDIVDKPEGDHYPGLGIYFESVPCKDFVLRLEGEVNFYCMYTQAEIKKMPSSYQTILTTLWNDSSLKNIKHTINGTTYLNAAIVHLMGDNNQFNLIIDENCNCYNKFTRVQKSVTVLGSTYQGAGYTFDKEKVTTEEMNSLLSIPESRVNHTYSILPIKASGTYTSEVKLQVERGEYYLLDTTGIKFVKYGEDMPFEIDSIQQLTSEFGSYELTENGGKFYIGQYLITYKVTDKYDGGYQYFTTKIIVTGDTPGPIIVFTYLQNKGSGLNSEDPFIWIGKKVGTIFDPDYEYSINLFFGVQAYNYDGTSIPYEDFTITCRGVTFSNTSEAVYSYTANNEENYTFAITYKVTDKQGKVTTAQRYIKMDSYKSNPNNGTAPSVTRSVTGPADLYNVNIGEISINSAGTIVVCDGKTSYSFTATGKTNYVFNDDGTLVQKNG